MYNVSPILMNTVEKPNVFSAKTKQLNAQSAAVLFCQANVLFLFINANTENAKPDVPLKTLPVSKTTNHTCETFPSLLTHSAFYPSFNAADFQFL
jgi:hypothetical protein